MPLTPGMAPLMRAVPSLPRGASPAPGPAPGGDGPPGAGAPGIAGMIQKMFESNLSRSRGADPNFLETQTRQLKGAIGALINHTAFSNDNVGRHYLKAMGALDAALKEIQQQKEKQEEARAIQLSPAGPPGGAGQSNPLAAILGMGR